MSTIVAAEAWLVDIPVETTRTDSIQSFVKQETVICDIRTDDGLTGTGYSYTIGNGGTSVLALLNEQLLPRLIGTEANHVEARWFDMFNSTRATTVGALTSLALAAADIALWDLKCKRSGEPLWVTAGGATRGRPAYDTEGGWLHLGVDDLVAGARAAIETGLVGVKIKIGKESIAEDVERVAAVRAAIGDHGVLLVDANQSMTYPRAKQVAHAIEPYQIGWLEEPLLAGDLVGHQRLAESTSIPIAVGESMYSIEQFAQYVITGAAGIVQVDVARVGGITPWLKVAHLAEACNLKVAPHFLMELHVSLVSAVPNGMYVEHIPQLRGVTNTTIEIADGIALPSDEPGIGIDWNRDKLLELRVAGT